ncbi:MAG: FAD-dependent oxidoreductase [Solirubrobacterales bacterium]
MSEAPKILVAGSGPGALEATLALSGSASIAAEISLISPQTEFVYRPNSVMEPFGVVETASYSVGEIIRHPRVQQWLGTIERVDAAAGKAYSPEGDEFSFDALVLATGATPTAYLPAPAITVATPGSMDELKSVVAEIDSGVLRNVLFTMPAGPSYPLPLYELAVMTADRADQKSVQQVAVGVTTPELAPLEYFGAEHSAEVSALCRELELLVRLGQTVIAYDGERATLSDGMQIDADRVITMPALEPSVPEGVPVDGAGFVPVDDHQLVPGTTNVYAVGDVTNRGVKQGGLASLEADAAARAIERQLGAAADAAPLDPILEGILLTTRRRIPLRARVTADGSESLPAELPSGPSQKIHSRLLAERLRELPS